MAEYVSLRDQRRMFITLPDVDEQRGISRTLGRLDDKIELNRKMNRTLEEIAQTLFRAWFVDFEGETDLVDSELGRIPRGWEAKDLGSLAHTERELVDPTSIDPETPYVGLANMQAGTISAYGWGRAADVTSAKMAFSKGDILFGKLRSYFKKVIVAPFAGVCSSDILVIRARDERLFGLVLGVLTDDRFIDFCDGASTGTRMPRVNWRSMSRYGVALPRVEDRIRKLNEVVRAGVARIDHGLAESRTLAELRDTLLPKLISGEVRVPEAEELVEEAV